MLMKWLHKLASMHYPLRPPGAVSEDRFMQLCIRCRKCVEVCPFKSIKISRGFPGIDEGTPYIVPREIPCYLCMKCPPVCPTGALKNNIKKEEVKMGIAVINQSTCMAYNGIICRACFERCPMYREAIILKDEIYPVVVSEKCTGCGVCENVCLTEDPSIIVVSKEERNQT